MLPKAAIFQVSPSNYQTEPRIVLSLALGGEGGRIGPKSSLFEEELIVGVDPRPGKWVTERRAMAHIQGPYRITTYCLIFHLGGEHSCSR